MRRFLSLALFAALVCPCVHLLAEEDQATDASDAAEATGTTDTAEAPGAAEALFEKALALEKSGDFEGAVKPYLDALDADPGLSKADRELGNCFYQLGWKEQALGHYQDYLDSGEDDPKVQALVDALSAEQQKLEALTRQALLAAAGPWSLQAEIGWGLGLNQNSYGHRFNRQGNANPFDYDYAVGQGFIGGLEPQFAVNSNLAVGLDFVPVWTNERSTSTGTVSGASATDSTQLQELALPVLLTVHTRAKLGPNWRITSFAGVGGVFSQPYVETSVDSLTDATGTYSDTVRYQRDYAPDLAFRGGLGMDLLLTTHCSFIVNASLLLAHQQPESVMYSSQIENSKGQLVGSSTASESYSVAPPATQSVAVPTIPTTNPAGAVAGQGTYSYNNGPTQWTTTVYYGPQGKLNPEKTQFNETVILPTSGSGDEVNIKVLSLTACIRWEF